MGMRKGIALAFIVALAATTAHGEYTLKIKQGKYPEGVNIENLNGNIPQSSWYKNGWTDKGWTSGDYGTTYDVALSPSSVSDGVCENALTLPSMMIEDGEWLSWDGCEIYPLFSDSYTVEFRAQGAETWITLGDYIESRSMWSTHMIDLSPYCGKEGEIRFVCRSTNGYMLGLSNISIKKPTDHVFTSTNLTPKFFATGELEDGNAIVEITVMNTGVPVSSSELGIIIDGVMVSSLSEDNYWPTGETRSFQMPLPLIPNFRTDYTITINPSDKDQQIIDKSFAYCTSFKRHLYVDKGTGMWCNLCPNGTLAIEELENTYGDALIVGDTHNGDPLANDIDFTWLRFHSIPQLELNHVQSTKGETTSKFDAQICVPTEMGITINNLTIKSDGELSVNASVSTSDSFSDTDKTFRIGYILTHNVAGNDNLGYYQKNICTTAQQKQYRYLPSTMVANMCSFPNVTIPSRLATLSENPAFTGINESLPESLAAGETYDYEWDIPIPEGFDNFDGMRLVLFIINARTNNIINSTATYIDDYASIEELTESPIESKTGYIFTIEGREVSADVSGLTPGVYIINGKKVLIK